VPKKAQPAQQHASVRKEHATELAEDYVEAIAHLIEADGECRLKEIAAHFGVSHVTANRTVARLKRDGLVQSELYGPIVLTAAGKRLAKRCKERHQAVYDFLLALGVSPEDAASDAEGIEHHVGPSTLKAMARFTAGSGKAQK
jgi:DtxR family manganese transport transcriptional regulator